MSNNKIFITKSSMAPYEEYIEAIRPLWDSHWLTNMGIYHKQFESELRDYLKVDDLSLMVNGHMALELAIQSFGFPEGAEVITTPFTFISTTHAIVRNRLKPVFCDIKEADGTIDENKIENLITEKTVAILPVHVYGNVCNIKKINSIARKYELKVIYDAAHAFGIRYLEKGIGCYGDVSVFSFHATKVFNTIEGGAVTFSDHRIYDKLYNLKNFGIHGEELVTDIGANAKMNEFCAIMGICNLKHIDKAILDRRDKYEYYRKSLSVVKDISFFDISGGQTYNYAYLPILFKNIETRDTIYEELRINNIYARKYFYPLTSDQACFKNKYKTLNLDVARSVSERVLTLPLYEGILFSEIDSVTKIIKNKLCVKQF